MTFPPFTVLMSVYKGTVARHLDECMYSLFRQTAPPDQIVVVMDGPVANAVGEVLVTWRKAFPCGIDILPLQRNSGLGNALAAGMRLCRHDIVARMDDDDVCDPHRFETQLRLLSDDPALAAVGSWISEFARTATDDGQRIRKVPVSPVEVRRYAATRCPMNHMTVVFRKSSVEDAGGYENQPFTEDYWLWARMLHRGQQLANIPQPLVFVRSGPAQYSRRGGLRYALSEARLFTRMQNLGFINLGRMCLNIGLRFPLRLLPAGLRTIIYMRLLRR